MTKYDDDDLDYDLAGNAGQTGSRKQNDDILDIDPAYDDILDDGLMDDAGWDDPVAASPPPRKAMKSGKSFKKNSGKKSPLFNILLIGGAVAVGLALILIQFGGSSKTPQPEPVAVPPQVQAPITPAVPTDGAAIPNAAELAGLQDQQNMQGQFPQAPSTAPSVDTTTAPAQGGLLNDPSLMPQAQAPTPTPNPITPATEAAPALLPAASLPAPTVENQDVTAPPVNEVGQVGASAVQAQDAPKIADAPTPAPQMSDAPKAPETPKVETAQPANTTIIANTELEAMRAELAALRSKVEDLQSKPATVADEVKPEPKRKTTSAKPKTSKPKSKPKTQKSAPKKPSWELRGIAGGEAVIARAGSDNFQTIGVGDNLSGIGRVTDIRQQNGAWVVIGTEGRIRQ